MDDVHTSMYLYARAPDHHPPISFLKVKVGVSVIGVGPAVVLLSQSWRQSAIPPASLLTLTRSWRASLAPIHAVFVSVSLLPSLVVVIAGAVARQRLFVSLVAMIRH